MAIPTLVQQSSTYQSTGGSTTIVTATGSSVSTADSLILGVQWYGSNQTPTPSGVVTDSLGGTWTSVYDATPLGPLPVQYFWFVCNNPASGTHSTTFTASAGASYGGVSFLQEWSGGPFTYVTANSQEFTSATTGSTPSITPSPAGQLILAQGTTDYGGCTFTTPTNGFTALTGPGGTQGTYVECAYLYDTSASSISCSWTITPASAGNGAIISFQPPTSTKTSGLLAFC
jgi:hypothetical protein